MWMLLPNGATVNVSIKFRVASRVASHIKVGDNSFNTIFAPDVTCAFELFFRIRG